MLMRHGLAGLPLMRNRTGSGLRQFALTAFARAGLTRTKGFTPRILIVAANRELMATGPTVASYLRHNGCFSGSQAAFCLELATVWVMKFMPSTPSATLG